VDRLREAVDDRNARQAPDRRCDGDDVDALDAASVAAEDGVCGRDGLPPGKRGREAERCDDRDDETLDDYFPIRRLSSSSSASARA
jgi:hypothetical protein